MAASRPNELTIRTYQVGFGDCFLLTFHYPPKNGAPNDRHVLIDFGSTHTKRGMKPGFLKRIAEDIKGICGKKLHAVVATHRHKDHISGFATNAQRDAPGDIIASLAPDVVVQPWTEDPDARTDATVPTKTLTNNKAFVRSLAGMNAFAGHLSSNISRYKGLFGAKRLKEFSFLGENNIANESAVKNLMRMGKAGRASYVYANSKSGLEKVLPGVKVRVLGPPTLEQSNAIRKQRSKDAAEFWHMKAAANREVASRPPKLFRNADRYSHVPAYTRWFVDRLDAVSADQLFQIVRILDNAMNNTSVILLFEVGKTKLLFPGDAQIENWSYALGQKDIMKALEDVSVYKVGHHGSLNATPISLWDNFKKKSDDPNKATRLRTFMSTCPGVHGSTQRKTEVPRKKLKDALVKDSTLVSTDGMKGSTLCDKQVIKLK